MASLKLDHIYKVYPNGTKAVNDFNLDIKDGEFIVFVGPSGCGKSTTLRMIAGLEEISAGELYIGDTLVNDMEPKDRDIAMVFQNYALYPHMTVYENMAFGLQLRRVPRNEIHEKVMWAADILGLKEYLDRKPKAMSGGQRQRVSLGRAILRNPKVMLLDEPLSNLDAKLRSQMRSEISKLHQNLKTTFIYVTHDQVEAMTLGTRVVVMKLGRIQQVDTPKNLYDFPVNKFVAGFIGTPQMNFFNTTLTKTDKGVELRFTDCEQPVLLTESKEIIKAKKRYLDGQSPIIFGIRCEALSVEEEDLAKGKNIIDVTVSHFEELGNETLIYGDLDSNASKFGTTKTGVIIKATSNKGYRPGDKIKVYVDLDRAHYFDAETEMTILPRIPSESVVPATIQDSKMTLINKTIAIPPAIDCESFKGNVIVPIDSIHLSEGDFEAVISKIENVDGKLLVYLSYGDELLFVLGDETLKVGDKVKFSIDIEKTTLQTEEGEEVRLPLIDKDTVYSTFVNFKTAYAADQDPEFVRIKEEGVAEVVAKYDALEEELTAKYEKLIAEVVPCEDETAVKAEIAETKETTKAKLKEIKATFKAEMREAKAEYAAKLKEIKLAVKAEYDEMYQKELNDYRLAISTNKDRDAIRARKAAFESFKETLPATRQNDLNGRINAASFDFDTIKSGITSRYSRAKFDLISDCDQKVKQLNFQLDGVGHYQKELSLKLKQLHKEREEALLHANLLFFFNYGGLYQILPKDITTKIIQGLGSKVFTKTFRIRVPHDGYVVSDKGIAFNVVDLVDYGSNKFYRCEGNMYGEVVTIYIKDTGVKLEGEVKVLPVLEKTEIYETSLNIRLY